MNWILKFLRNPWPWRRPRATPAQPPAEVVHEPMAEAVTEPIAEAATVPVEAPAPPEPPPTPPAELVDAMPPLPPETEPPLLLGESARIGPAPAVARPEFDNTPAADPVGTEVTEDEGEDEDGGQEDESYGEDDLSEPDPFISTEAPVIEALSLDELGHLRAEARVLALSGEHRVLLSDIAGPGSLGEALNRLLQQGKVFAQFHDPEGEEPYLLYSPVEAPPQAVLPTAAHSGYSVHTLVGEQRKDG